MLCKGMGLLAQRIRSLFDKEYRRAFRNLRHLPRLKYRFVVDAGANRGGFTDAFLRLHHPERVLLVEANPEFAVKLRDKYSTDARITVIAAYFSGGGGEATFEINSYVDASSLLPIDPRNSEWWSRDLSVARSIVVPTVSLEELVSRENLETVDLLKLDVQGAERLVLSGAADILNRVRVIYTEVFFEALYSGAWLFRETNEFLAAHGFKLCGLSNIVHAGDGDLLQANATFRKIAVT